MSRCFGFHGHVTCLATIATIALTRDLHGCKGVQGSVGPVTHCSEGLCQQSSAGTGCIGTRLGGQSRLDDGRSDGEVLRHRPRPVTSETSEVRAVTRAACLRCMPGPRLPKAPGSTLYCLFCGGRHMFPCAYHLGMPPALLSGRVGGTEWRVVGCDGPAMVSGRPCSIDAVPYVQKDAATAHIAPATLSGFKLRLGRHAA